jgi:hypothetical protein
VSAVLHALSEGGDGAEAIRWTRARIEHEPLCEEANRDLIRLLARSGNRPAALAAADALTERLRRELRIPPSPETRALVEDVRRGRVGGVADAAQPPLPAPLARTVHPEGREPLLARLRSAWDAAGAGALRFAVATGEPGIGKTTLLGEFARRVHADGAAVLFGRSDEQALLPYQPWVEALERHLAALGPADRERRLADGALARLLPTLRPAPAWPDGTSGVGAADGRGGTDGTGRRGGADGTGAANGAGAALGAGAPLGAAPTGEPTAAVAPGGADASERYRAFEAVRALLEETAAERPVLLVLDDLQWADADSLHLLRHLARMAHGARVLVAISTRQAEVTPAVAAALADVRREGPLLQLQLGGLDEDAVAAVLARHDATGDAAAYRERTGGNPFFLDELLRDEAEHGRSAVPPGVREVIGRRIARLPEPARCVLQAGAALGLEFEPLVLTTRELVVEGLHDAVAAGLLTRVDDRRYAFPHGLIAETVLAEMSLPRRASLHLRIADALAELGARHGEIVRHVRAAGHLAPPERLVAAELAAAREAEAMLAYDDAAAHYEAALTAMGGTKRPARAAGGRAGDTARAGRDTAWASGGARAGDTAWASAGDARSRDTANADGAPAGDAVLGGGDPAEVLLALGAARDRAGMRGKAREAFRVVVGIGRDTRDPVLLARAALGLGGVGVLVAAPDREATRAIEEALARLPKGERALAARLRARLAIEIYYPDRAGAEELSARAVEDARASGDPAALAAAFNARRVACWTPELIDERLEAATEMIEAAERAGDREGVLQGRNWRVVDLMELGRRAELEAEIDEYEALADRVGLAHYRWFTPLWRSALAQLEGRWDDARHLGAHALALAGLAEDPMAPWLVRAQHESTLDVRGLIEQVDRDWYAEMAGSSVEPWAWLTCLAYFDASMGEHQSAQETLTEVMSSQNLPDTVNWHVLAELAEAATLVGDTDSAEPLHARLAPNARLFPVVARGGICLGSTEYFLGRLASALGRTEEAEQRLERAVAENRRIGAAPRAVIALHRLGELRGDRDTLLAAAAQADALDMPGVAERARAAAHRVAAYAS